MSFSVIDHGNENARSFESRSEADDKARGIKQMVSDPSAIEVVKATTTTMRPTRQTTRQTPRT